MTTTTSKTSPLTEGHRKLVYDTTRWERLLFDARVGAGAVRDAVQTIASADAAISPADRPVAAPNSKTNARDFGTEVFARLYADPAKLDEPAGPAWVKGAHEVMDGLPELDGLRETVAGDPDMAALAAAEIMHAIAAKLPELAEAEQKRANGDVNGASAEAAAVRSALRRGIGIAGRRIEDAREALAGLAPGLEAAPPTHEQADGKRLALAERLLKEPRLREVLRRAGRIQRLARDRRTTRDEHAKQEVVDIERGADLARILPAGLVRLRHPLLRKLALREIVERQAIQYRLEGRETLGRGPIVVLLDRSGSMSGDPELWASATAIALLGAGAREKRAVTVVEFTAVVDGVSRFAAGSGERLASADPAQVQATGIPLSALALGIASRSSSGGTDFGPVLRYGLRAGALDDRADLVIVTDGLADADEGARAALADAKKRGLRLWALTVNGGSLSPTIAELADAAVDLDGAEDVGAAIADALPA